MRVVRHDRKRGLAAAFNTGTAAARGQFVAYLLAGDEWNADKLKLQMDAFSDAGDDLVADLEQRVSHLPSLGEKFAENQEPELLVQEVFKKHSPRFLANRRIEFMCHCNKKRLQEYLAMLPQNDIEDIRRNGPFPLELRCHMCNTAYEFSEVEIEEIYGEQRKMPKMH